MAGVDFLGTIQQIIDVALRIKALADTVKANRAKSARLARRVADLVPTLSALKTSAAPKAGAEEAAGAAGSLLLAVRDAEALIAKHGGRNVVMRLFKAGDDSAAFDAAHVDIDRACATLSTVLQVEVKASVVTAQQRAEDEREDQRAILALLQDQKDVIARFQEESGQKADAIAEAVHALRVQGVAASDEMKGMMQQLGDMLQQQLGEMLQKLVVSRPTGTSSSPVPAPRPVRVGGAFGPNLIRDNELKVAWRDRPLGKGAMGTVFRGEWLGLPVAVKKVTVGLDDAATRREVDRECAVHASLRHPNILQFYGACVRTSEEDEDSVLLVTELAEGGTLAEHARSAAVRAMSPAQKAALLLPVARALQYMASRPNPIAHGDLKPQNVLLAGGVPKLADFGLSRWRMETLRSRTKIGGTPNYGPPELWSSDYYPSTMADVFAFGYLLWETLTGQEPWAGLQTEQLFATVRVEGKRPAVDPSWPAPLRALLAACWEADPTRRPTFDRVVQMLLSVAATASAPAAAAVRPLSTSPPPQPAGAAAQPAELRVEPAGMFSFGKSSPIMDAVRGAAPGQTIRLAPGRYTEAVVLEKEVHIVGPREAVLEWDKDTKLLCRGPAAPSVKGITIRNTAAKSGAVGIAGGSRAALEGCDVSSAGYCGIYVKGEGTAPALRSNVVHDCGQAGIYFITLAKGTVEGNDVFGNTYAGIYIKTGADPVVRGNKFHDGKDAGIFVCENGRGTVEGNDVFGNALSNPYAKNGARNPAISIWTGGDPVVRGNKIGEHHWGIIVEKGGKGTIDGNTLERIRGGPENAIIVEKDCTGCRVEGNTIR